MVEVMAGLIIPEDDMVQLVTNPQTNKPISPVTLRKVFREELDSGFAKLKVRQHQALFKAIEDGNVTAMIWWDKTRNKIREKVGFELPTGPTSPTGQPVDVNADATDPKSLDIARRIAFVLSQGAAMPAQPTTSITKKAKASA